MTGLPKIGDLFFLNPSDGQSPPHDLDHVSMHVICSQAQPGSGSTQWTRLSHRSTRRIPFGDMGNRHSRVSCSYNILWRQEEAMRGGEPIIEQAGLFQQLHRRFTVPLFYPLDFAPALSQMSVDPQLMCAAGRCHLPEQPHRTGIRSMSGKLNPDSSIFLSMPFALQIQSSLESPVTDRRVVSPNSVRHF
jgi:hypothetical protein